MKVVDIATRSLGLGAIVLCFLMANTELFTGLSVSTHRYAGDGVQRWSATPFELLPPLYMDPWDELFPLHQFAKSNGYAAGIALLILTGVLLPRRLRILLFAGLAVYFGVVLLAMIYRFPEYLADHGHQVNPVGLVLLFAFVLTSIVTAAIQPMSTSHNSRLQRARVATAVAMGVIGCCMFTAWVFITVADDRFTILEATATGNVALIRHLLNDDQALVGARDAAGFTPLHIALSKGNDEIARLLVDHGADVAPPHLADTPLHRAARSCSADTVELLITKGADINSRSSQGGTPLHDAARHGRRSVVRALLDHGASSTATDNRGWTPLHKASCGGNVGVVDMLLKHGSVANARDSTGTEPLHLAKNAGVALSLLDGGADVNTQNAEGDTPLMRALLLGRMDVAEILLTRGADMDIRRNMGWSCLDAALIGDDRDHAAEFLILAGADLNKVSEFYGTPLRRAVYNGDKQLVELMLSKGADVNLHGKYTRTPLQEAIRLRRTDIADLLRQHGAVEDPREEDRKGIAPSQQIHGTQ